MNHSYTNFAHSRIHHVHLSANKMFHCTHIISVWVKVFMLHVRLLGKRNKRRNILLVFMQDIDTYHTKHHYE